MASFVINQLAKLLSRKKKGTKRARVFRKRVYRKGRNMAKPNGAIQIKRITQYDKDYVNTSVVETGNYTFELSDLPDYVAFANLYEYFRIDKVKVDFRAMNNIAQHAANTVGGNFTSMGRIHSVIDYNSANNYNATRAGIQDMMKDNSYKCTTSNQNHSRTFVPKILIEAGGTSVGAISKGKQWIPTGATTVPLTHYCLKWALEGGDGASGSASFVIEPTITMWVSFKDIKSQ